jgi:hypothetical protein
MPDDIPSTFNGDAVAWAEYALEWGNGDQLHRALVAELKTARAELERVRNTAEEPA